MRYTTIFILLLALTLSQFLAAQQQDSTIIDHTGAKESPEIIKPHLRFKSLALPLCLITYGIVSQSNEDLKDFDVDIRKEVRKDADFHTPIDNYLQYAPGAAVYVLNAAGIRGEHNFRDRTLIYFLSNLMMGVTVQSIKKVTKVQRPDGFGTNAFPSGHTATAFAGAEFLRREYANVSAWYGIAGYAVAATTGILRMYNNKHWFRDVMAGAGFGILSTDVAYYLEPIIAKKLFHKRKETGFNASVY